MKGFVVVYCLLNINSKTTPVTEMQTEHVAQMGDKRNVYKVLAKPV
jgi:hypothetical protein